MRAVTRSWLAAALLWTSVAAVACPICMGLGQPSTAEKLVAAPGVVLALPAADASSFRVIQVIKGEPPKGGLVEGGYPRSGVPARAAAPSNARPLLLVRDDPLPTWVILGTIDAGKAGWLHSVAAGKRAVDMSPPGRPKSEHLSAQREGTSVSPQEWRTRVAFMLPYLEHREPLVAEIAFGELSAAPYAALLSLKPRLDAPSIRKWLADPDLAQRQSLYLLLLGIVGTEQDATRLESQLEARWQAGDATNLSALLAADLQLRGPARMAWVDAKYLRDQKRATREHEAVLLALAVHGDANSAIARERVIQSYRLFMREHHDIAGYAAPKLAEWQYWDAVPEYLALMQSDVRQQLPSRIAIIAYLRQSPAGRAGALGPLLKSASSGTPMDATRTTGALAVLPK